MDELSADESASRMAETTVPQPANFALQVGLAELWASLGVVPAAIVGHSAGEVAAAYFCGLSAVTPQQGRPDHMTGRRDQL
jgi:acyl transferase domain-containing protein